MCKLREDEILEQDCILLFGILACDNKQRMSKIEHPFLYFNKNISV